MLNFIVVKIFLRFTKWRGTRYKSCVIQWWGYSDIDNRLHQPVWFKWCMAVMKVQKEKRGNNIKNNNLKTWANTWKFRKSVQGSPNWTNQINTVVHLEKKLLSSSPSWLNNFNGTYMNVCGWRLTPSSNTPYRPSSQKVKGSPEEAKMSGPRQYVGRNGELVGSILVGGGSSNQRERTWVGTHPTSQTGRFYLG